MTAWKVGSLTFSNKFWSQQPCFKQQVSFWGLKISVLCISEKLAGLSEQVERLCNDLELAKTASQDETAKLRFIIEEKVVLLSIGTSLLLFLVQFVLVQKIFICCHKKQNFLWKCSACLDTQTFVFFQEQALSIERTEKDIIEAEKDKLESAYRLQERQVFFYYPSSCVFQWQKRGCSDF